MSSRNSRPRERGVALVAVLGISLIMGAIGIALLREGRSALYISRNVVDLARARAVAEAAIHLAAFRLLDPVSALELPVDGTPISLTFAGETVEVTLRDVFGKVDLNAASELILQRLGEAAGLPPADAGRLAAAIADWRDADDIASAIGAEAPAYAAASLPYGPANRPFQSVRELQQVLGLAPHIYAELQPALTIFSRREQVNVNAAPPIVLQAIEGLSEPELRRKRGMQRSAPSETAPPARGQAFEVSARVRLPSGTGLVRIAVIRLTGNPGRPFWIQDWRLRYEDGSGP